MGKTKNLMPLLAMEFHFAKGNSVSIIEFAKRNGCSGTGISSYTGKSPLFKRGGLGVIYIGQDKRTKTIEKALYDGFKLRTKFLMERKVDLQNLDDELTPVKSNSEKIIQKLDQILGQVSFLYKEFGVEKEV